MQSAVTDHERFMSVALEEAGLALAEGEFPVGCVFVQDDRVLCRGRRLNSGENSRNEIDHAEVSAFRKLIRANPDLDLSTVRVYSTMEPCLMCYSTMLLSGVRTFIWAYEDVMGGGGNLPLYMLNPLYAQMRVTLIDRVCRKESLELFQQFFQEHSYWQDSLLANYTLAQPIEDVR